MKKKFKSEEEELFLKYIPQVVYDNFNHEEIGNLLKYRNNHRLVKETKEKIEKSKIQIEKLKEKIRNWNIDKKDYFDKMRLYYEKITHMVVDFELRVNSEKRKNGKWYVKVSLVGGKLVKNCYVGMDDVYFKLSGNRGTKTQKKIRVENIYKVYVRYQLVKISSENKYNNTESVINHFKDSPHRGIDVIKWRKGITDEEYNKWIGF